MEIFTKEQMDFLMNKAILETIYHQESKTYSIVLKNAKEIGLNSLTHSWNIPAESLEKVQNKVQEYYLDRFWEISLWKQYDFSEWARLNVEENLLDDLQEEADELKSSVEELQKLIDENSSKDEITLMRILFWDLINKVLISEKTYEWKISTIIQIKNDFLHFVENKEKYNNSFENYVFQEFFSKENGI